MIHYLPPPIGSEWICERLPSSAKSRPSRWDWWTEAVNGRDRPTDDSLQIEGGTDCCEWCTGTTCETINNGYVVKVCLRSMRLPVF
jgi:hypothetical protein